MSQGSRTPPEVLARIEELVREADLSAAQVLRHLQRDFEGSSLRGQLPGERTIRSIARRVRRPAEREPDPEADAWCFADPRLSPEDAAIVLHLRAELVADYRRRYSADGANPRPRWGVLQRPRVAAWAVRLRRAFPGMTANRTLSMAQDYARAEAAATSGGKALQAATAELDAELVRWLVEEVDR